MNIRLQKYKANRLAGMNQYNAAKAAGYSESMALKHTQRLEKAENGGIEALLEQAGLTDRALAEHIHEGVFEAVKPYGKDGLDGPDWGTRHKYCETVLKLKGKLKDSGKEGNVIGSNNSVQVLIINKGVDGTDLHNTQERSNGQRVDIGAEAVIRFSQPNP